MIIIDVFFVVDVGRLVNSFCTTCAILVTFPGQKAEGNLPLPKLTWCRESRY